MSIIYQENTKEFHLGNDFLSYIIRILPNGRLENLYFGKKVHEKESYAYLHEEQGRALAAMEEGAGCLCMQYVRQEYPDYGTGDYRCPAFVIERENGSRITEFRYQSHSIYKGKKDILPLPATYVEDEEEADSLEIVLWDSLLCTKIILKYTLYRALPVLTRSVKFIHEGDSAIVLHSAMSASIDLPDMEYEMVSLSGAHARERYVKNRKLEMGVQAIYSMRGISSLEHNPFFALKRKETTENSGEAIGFSLVYSGNFLGQVEVCTHDMARAMIGIHPDTFEWQLKVGEEFQTPEVVMVYSKKGLNGMSQAYHRLYRTRLAKGEWRDKERPILLNNWEATYMDFNEESLLRIAAKAKEAGVELFVLDDGWFGKRNNDCTSLGDWYPNLEKLPNGLAQLSQKINAMGLMFGLWIEPEMVNKDSDLYRQHPDWLLTDPERYARPSRNQFVLDFGRDEIVEYIYRRLENIITEANIGYIKWDMNRYLSNVYGRTAAPEEQGKVMHRYILGVYRLYARLAERFPQVLFESCSSGGGRFDPGMLFFAPQVWCSDNTDGYERIKIQYGTSYVYPLSSIGSHVSAVPNHQMRRVTSLAFRANVAYFGTFGYEMDLNRLEESKILQVKEQVVFMKRNRKLLQQGVFYRLLNPFEGNEAAWMVVSEDRKRAIAAFYQKMNKVNPACLRFYLKGLDENIRYRVFCDGMEGIYYGSELMYMGLPVERRLLDKEGGDFTSVIYELEEVL